MRPDLERWTEGMVVGGIVTDVARYALELEAQLRERDEALPPDPEQVPQWGLPDYREAVRKMRAVALSTPETGKP